MALTNLGNFQVDIGSGWVSYNGIEVEKDKGYLILIQIDSANPDFIYSRFVFRYRYPTKAGTDSVSEQIATMFYDPLPQYFFVKINKLLANKDDIIFQVRRFPNYQRLSNLSTATVQVSLDPDETF